MQWKVPFALKFKGSQVVIALLFATCVNKVKRPECRVAYDCDVARLDCPRDVLQQCPPFSQPGGKVTPIAERKRWSWPKQQFSPNLVDRCPFLSVMPHTVFLWNLAISPFVFAPFDNMNGMEPLFNLFGPHLVLSAGHTLL